MKSIAILLGVSLIAGNASAGTPHTKDNEKGVIAEILGKKITIEKKDKLNGLIFGVLLDRFAKANKIEPTEQELDDFVLKTEEREKQQRIKFAEDRKKLVAALEADNLTDRERKDKESRLQTIESILKSIREMKEQTEGMGDRLRTMKRRNARQFVKSWKINKALYAKYGGRVIFQQAGVEPLDAYRDFLREQEKNGAFRILDKKYEAPFWRYFTNDAMHTFYPENEGAKFINTPWWMMEQPPEN